MTHRDDIDQARPRCPGCNDHAAMERLRRGPKRWWCGACNLACDGSTAEHRAASEQRHAEEAAEAERQRNRLAVVREELS